MNVFSRLKHVQGWLSSLLLFCSLALLAGCPGTPPEPEVGVTDVLILSFAFDPPTVTITQGEKVRWTNQDVFPHTATSGSPDNPANTRKVFHSEILLQNQSFTHQFNKQGNFIYFCEVHPGIMRDARVIVQAAPGENEGEGGESGEGGG